MAEPDLQWKIDVLKEQVTHSVERLDERRGIIHIRRHLASSPAFKGLSNFRSTRIAMLQAGTITDLFSIMDSVARIYDNQKISE